jgi:hypothetical protein
MRWTLIVIVVAGCGRLGFDDEPGYQPVNTTAQSPGHNGAASTSGESTTVILPSADMVAYWGFEDLTDSGAMSSVNDYAAACDNPADCPNAVPGALGDGASFDGTAACMHVPTLGSVMPQTLTMSAWINMSASAMSGFQPVITRDGDGCSSPGLEVSDSQLAFQFMGGDGNFYYAWAPAPAAGAWHQVSARWDGTTPPGAPVRWR